MVTESFGQLLVTCLLTVRFHWLLEKDYKSFGLNFQTYIILTMAISFVTMIHAIYKYHKRNRRSLRPMASLATPVLLITWSLLITMKVFVYVICFINTPGLFFVPAIVKMFVSLFLFQLLVADFKEKRRHEKFIFLLISFIVPTSLPSEQFKSMRWLYFINFTLYYAECTGVLIFAAAMKHFYHNKLYCRFYEELPRLVFGDKFYSDSFDIFLIQVFCLVTFVTLISGLFMVIYSKLLHPRTSLFQEYNKEDKLSCKKLNFWPWLTGVVSTKQESATAENVQYESSEIGTNPLQTSTDPESGTQVTKKSEAIGNSEEINSNKAITDATTEANLQELSSGDSLEGVLIELATNTNKLTGVPESEYNTETEVSGQFSSEKVPTSEIIVTELSTKKIITDGVSDEIQENMMKLEPENVNEDDMQHSERAVAYDVNETIIEDKVVTVWCQALSKKLSSSAVIALTLILALVITVAEVIEVLFLENSSPEITEATGSNSPSNTSIKPRADNIQSANNEDFEGILSLPERKDQIKVKEKDTASVTLSARNVLEK